MIVHGLASDRMRTASLLAARTTWANGDYPMSTAFAPHLTGVERVVGVDEIIITKTDVKGGLTYCNQVFERISGYSAAESLGAPHSVVRHPDMPRCLFKMMWAAIEAGSEFISYILNRASNGDHYWVLVRIFPNYDGFGRLDGFHSKQRPPSRTAVDRIAPIYRSLVEEEARYADGKKAVAASSAMFADLLRQRGLTYDEFVFSI